MLHYDTIDISEGIDPTKSNKSNSGCQNLTMLSVNIGNIVAITV